MILVPASPVKSKRRIVVTVHFKMDGLHAHFARSFFGKGKSPTAITVSPIGGINVQLVDECVVSAEFETEPHGQHNISHGFAPFAEEQHSSECRERQRLP